MAPHERDKTTAGLLQSSLGRDAAVRSDCPDPEILAAYCDRALDSDELERYQLHFSQCPQCREQLATVARAEEVPQPVPHRVWLWDWRWLLPAVAALLVITLWIGQRSEPKGARAGTAEEPLVATSRLDQTAAPESRVAAQAPAPLSGASGARPPQRRVMDHLSAEIQNAPVASPSAPQETTRNGHENGRDRAGSKAMPNSVSPAPVATSQTADAQSARAAESPHAPEPLQPIPAAAGVAEGMMGKTSEGPTATSQEVPKQALSRAGRNIAALQAAPQGGEQRSMEVVIRTPDPQVLWRITGGRFVERSEDAGATWEGQLPDSNARLVAGAAPNTKICWLVGQAGIILVTKDAKRWKKIPPPVPADFVAVTAKSVSTAVVTAADGQKFATRNGGKKWTPAQ